MRKITKTFLTFLLFGQNDTFGVLEDSYNLFLKANHTLSHCGKKLTQNQEKEAKMAALDMQSKIEHKNEPIFYSEAKNFNEKVKEMDKITAFWLILPNDFGIEYFTKSADLANKAKPSTFFGKLHKNELSYFIARDLMIFNYRQKIHGTDLAYINLNFSGKPNFEEAAIFADLDDYLDVAMVNDDIPRENILAIMGFAQTRVHAELMDQFNQTHNHFLSPLLYATGAAALCATAGIIGWQESPKTTNSSAQNVTKAPNHTILPTPLHPTTNLPTLPPTTLHPTTLHPTTLPPTPNPTESPLNLEFLPIFHSASGDGILAPDGTTQTSYNCIFPFAASAIEAITDQAFKTPIFANQTGIIANYLRNNMIWPIKTNLMEAAILAQKTWENSIGNSNFSLSCYVGSTFQIPLYGNFSCQTLNSDFTLGNCTFKLTDGISGTFSTKNSTKIDDNWSIFSAYSIAGDYPTNMVVVPTNCDNTSCTNAIPMRFVADITKTYGQNFTMLSIPDGLYRIYSPYSQLSKITSFFHSVSLPLNSNITFGPFSTFNDLMDLTCNNEQAQCYSTNHSLQSSCDYTKIHYENATQIIGNKTITRVLPIREAANGTCTQNLTAITFSPKTSAPVLPNFNQIMNKLPNNTMESLPIFLGCMGDSLSGPSFGDSYNYFCQFPLSAAAIAVITNNTYRPPLAAKDASDLALYLQNNVSWPLDETTLTQVSSAQKNWTDSFGIPTFPLNCKIINTNLPIYQTFSCTDFSSNDNGSEALLFHDCTAVLNNELSVKISSDGGGLLWNETLFNARGISDFFTSK